MNNLDHFVSELYAAGSSNKTSGLDHFSVKDLGLIYGTPSSHLEAAEKLAYDSHCFLEQFEGTPLHAQAIALVGEDLQIEAERIQRDEARRAQQEPMDDSWSKQRMIDLKKRQLELELHKLKAGGGAEGQEPEAQEHAEGVPAPQTTGAPVKTAALKLARRSSSTTYYGDGYSRTHHSSQPDIDELRLAQRAWSKMSPEQRKETFGHLPATGALALGALGAIAGGHLGGLHSPGGAAAGIGLGALGGGLLGHAAGTSSRDAQAMRDEVPASASYRLARTQILNEEGRRRKTSALEKVAVTMPWVENRVRHFAEYGRGAAADRMKRLTTVAANNKARAKHLDSAFRATVVPDAWGDPQMATSSVPWKLHEKLHKAKRLRAELANTAAQGAESLRPAVDAEAAARRALHGASAIKAAALKLPPLHPKALAEAARPFVAAPGGVAGVAKKIQANAKGAVSSGFSRNPADYLKSANLTPTPELKALLAKKLQGVAKPTGRPLMPTGLKSTKFNRLDEAFKAAALEKVAISQSRIVAAAQKSIPERLARAGTTSFDSPVIQKTLARSDLRKGRLEAALSDLAKREGLNAKVNSPMFARAANETTLQRAVMDARRAAELGVRG